MIGQLLHAYLRVGAGYERTQVGPFLATFTPGNTHPNLNYAVPDDGIDPSSAEIAALVALYKSRGLRPRLEYASSAAPNLLAALSTAGFSIEATIPVLTCAPGQQRPFDAEGITVSDALDERDHEDAMRVAGVAYGETEAPIPGWAVTARVEMVRAGGAVAVARDNRDQRAVGSGLYPIPVAGVTEIAAVGTLPSHRQRGVATAVTGHLVNRAVRSGVRLAWLTAENDAERRAAEEVGFQDTGEAMVHVSLPVSSAPG